MFGAGKRRQRLLARYGKVPTTRYEEEDLRGIRAYFDHRRHSCPGTFHLDETTWYDLSMDTVFERVCQTSCTSGEQILYDQLRCPAVTQDEYERRRGLIHLMEGAPELRGRLQQTLERIGKHHAARTIEAFAPSAHGRGGLILDLLLLAGLLLSGGSLPFTWYALPLFVLLLVINPLYHIARMKRLDTDLPAANYAVALAAAYQVIRRERDAELTAFLQPYEQAGRRARRVARMGGVSFVANNDYAQLCNSFFLVDLILYELLKVRLGRLHNEVFLLHECIGRIDAAISVASYRKSVKTYCDPDLVFDAGAAVHLTAVDMAHPLLRHPVTNTLELDRPMLLTGSNASGKSTLIKAVALNAVLAQGICTAICSAYTATAFHIYTSMALSDDILSGESYFITELKAFRRILDAAERGERLLCAIDEVLRGTNTVERIAASSALLQHLAAGRVLCIAATHDIELCTLLEGSYAMAHFEETVTDTDVAFDYRMRPGPACTRNAIRLLARMGFAEEITDAAERRAEEYLQKGHW